jgi:hypothetical protein
MTIPASAAPPSVWAATAMIAAIVLCSTAGEVLTAAAMKSIGDLDEIRARAGLMGAIRAVVACPLFFAGVGFLALAFFSLLFALNHLNLSEPGRARLGLAHAGHQRRRRQALPQGKRRPPPLDRRRAGLHRGLSSGALKSTIATGDRKRGLLPAGIYRCAHAWATADAGAKLRWAAPPAYNRDSNRISCPYDSLRANHRR